MRQKCGDEATWPHQVRDRASNDEKVLWHEPCSLASIDSSTESDVNKHEKSQLNVGGLVDPKYIDGVGLCGTRGFPSSSQLALLEILASSW